MKYLKMLGLAIVAAAALTAILGAGTASAGTTLCKETITPCTPAKHYPVGTEIKASLKAGTKAILKAGFFTFECGKSTVAGKTETTTTPEGNLTSLTFTECNNEETKVIKPGKLQVHWIEGTHNGNLTVSGVEVTVKQFGTSCTYGGTITTGLTLNGGAPATMKANANIPRVAGGFLCGNPANWTAEYTVTAPSPLFVSNS